MTIPETDDFETWLMAWSRDRQTKAYEQQWKDTCPRCRHAFHGLGCRANDQGRCLCPTALEDVAS